MKIVEKISLIIFAYLLLIISIIACLLVFNWVSLQFVHEVVIAALNNTTVSNIILGVSAVIILNVYSLVAQTKKRIDKRMEFF